MGKVTDLRRRRFIGIAAAAASLPLLGAARAVETVRWRGQALGADAEIQLQHPDGHRAREVLAACLSEIERLEGIFSLYRPTSTLNRLNAAGHLDDPPLELVEVLSASRSLWRLSAGAFDPSIQPLWAARQSGGDIAKALTLVGFDAVEFAPAAIRLRRSGMALTLNGIAQGYVTERVAALLKARGFDNALVDLGEIAATGPRHDGSAWTVDVRDPFAADRVAFAARLDGLAMATTAPLGSLLAGQSHLIDPASGQPSNQLGSVTVMAPSATLADGLATALALMPRPQWGQALGAANARAMVVEHDGRKTTLA